MRKSSHQTSSQAKQPLTPSNRARRQPKVPNLMFKGICALFFLAVGVESADWKPQWIGKILGDATHSLQCVIGQVLIPHHHLCNLRRLGIVEGTIIACGYGVSKAMAGVNSQWGVGYSSFINSSYTGRIHGLTTFLQYGPKRSDRAVHGLSDIPSASSAIL